MVQRETDTILPPFVTGLSKAMELVCISITCSSRHWEYTKHDERGQGPGVYHSTQDGHWSGQSTLTLTIPSKCATVTFCHPFHR